MKILKKLVFLAHSLQIVPLDRKIYSKTISASIHGKRDSGEGSYGRYFQLSRSRGIKVLYGTFETIEKALNSSEYEMAVKESSLLHEAKTRYSNVPQSYGVRIVSKGDKFQIGIVMQHLGNHLAMDFFEDYEDFKHDLKPRLKENLEKVGIYHTDIHDENVIRYNDEWYILDFSPDRVTIK